MKKKFACAVIVAVILLSVMTGCSPSNLPEWVRFGRYNEVFSEMPPPSDVEFDPSAGDYQDQVQGTADNKPNVSIVGFGKLTIPPDTKENINVDLYNPIETEGYYNLTFEIRLVNPDAENGYEVLYTSGLVAPGKHIQKINLSKGLKEGTYECYLFVQPYYIPDLSQTINSTTLAFELIVK